MTHVDDNSKPYAVQCAKLLMNLTRGKTFRPFCDLFVEDVIFLGLTKIDRDVITPFPDYAYSESNDWLDRFQWIDFPNRLKNEFFRQCKLIVKSSSLNRFQKKQLEKSVFRNGRLAPEYIKTILESNNSEPMAIGKEFVFWEDFTSKERLIEYLAGKVTGKLFVDTALKNMMNVESFVSKVCDYDAEMREKSFLL